MKDTGRNSRPEQHHSSVFSSSKNLGFVTGTHGQHSVFQQKIFSFWSLSDLLLALLF